MQWEWCGTVPQAVLQEAGPVGYCPKVPKCVASTRCYTFREFCLQVVSLLGVLEGRLAHRAFCLHGVLFLGSRSWTFLFLASSSLGKSATIRPTPAYTRYELQIAGRGLHVGALRVFRKRGVCNGFEDTLFSRRDCKGTKYTSYIQRSENK